MNEKTQVGAPFSDGDPYLTEYTPSAQAPASPLLPGESIWYLDTPAERTRALEAFREETAGEIQRQLRGLFITARLRGKWLAKFEKAMFMAFDPRTLPDVGSVPYTQHVEAWSAILLDIGRLVGMHETDEGKARRELRELVIQHDRGMP